MLAVRQSCRREIFRGRPVGRDRLFIDDVGNGVNGDCGCPVSGSSIENLIRDRHRFEWLGLEIGRPSVRVNREIYCKCQRRSVEVHFIVKASVRASLAHVHN